MIDVRLIENKGCSWVMGSVFSLGLAPVLVRRNAQRSPMRLTEEEMILRNGTRIPWSHFTKVSSTDVYLNKRYIRTRYVLKHTRGQVAIENDGVYDAERVVQFILDRIPPEAIS